MSRLKASTSRLCLCFGGAGSDGSEKLLLNGLRGGVSGSEVSVLKGSSIGGSTGSGSGTGAFRCIWDLRRGATGGGGLRGATLGCGRGGEVVVAATEGVEAARDVGLAGDNTTDGGGEVVLGDTPTHGSSSSTASGEAIGAVIVNPGVNLGGGHVWGRTGW